MAEAVPSAHKVLFHMENNFVDLATPTKCLSRMEKYGKFVAEVVPSAHIFFSHMEKHFVDLAKSGQIHKVLFHMEKHFVSLGDSLCTAFSLLFHTVQTN